MSEESAERAESAESAAFAHGPYSEELANRALPLVRRIVGDVAVSEWRDYDAGSASANGTSSSMPSRAQPVAGNTSLASRSRSDGSRE